MLDLASKISPSSPVQDVDDWTIRELQERVRGSIRRGNLDEARSFTREIALRGWPADLCHIGSALRKIASEATLERIGKAVTQLAGSEDNNAVEDIAELASILSEILPDRAVELTTSAVRQAPTNKAIVNNHISILDSASKLEHIVMFLDERPRPLNGERSYRIAGEGFLNAGRYEDAFVHLRSASILERNPANHLLLAETHLKLTAYPEALAASTAGLVIFEESEPTVDIVDRWVPETKLSTLERAQASGPNAQFGSTTRQRLERIKSIANQAMDEATERKDVPEQSDTKETKPSSLDQAELTDGVTANEEMTPGRATEFSKHISELLQLIDRRATIPSNTKNVIDEIIRLQKDWKKSTTTAQSATEGTTISRSFKGRIYALSVLIRNERHTEFDFHWLSSQQRYRGLSPRAIEGLATASFLDATFGARRSPPAAYVASLVAIERGLRIALMDSQSLDEDHLRERSDGSRKPVAKIFQILKSALHKPESPSLPQENLPAHSGARFTPNVHDLISIVDSHIRICGGDSENQIRTNLRQVVALLNNTEIIPRNLSSRKLT
jgi:tetratricopeptide (TPR) repeat protein